MISELTLSMAVALILAGGSAARAAEDVASDAWPWRTVLSVQILLDRENFSCGSLDGVFGSRTRFALRLWQESRGLKPSGEIDTDVLRTTGDPERLFTAYTVTTQDVASLAPVPATWMGKSQAERLGYETILEMMGEKFHASEAALRLLNPEATWPSPPAGTRLVAPDPYPSRRVEAARLVVSVRRKTILIFDADGRAAGCLPCSIAQKAEKRPTGELKVVNCARDPDYTFDPALFVEDREAQGLSSKLRIPPGPNSPVGTAWIGLSLPGYGIHGTPRPEDIGKTESHGCFRLANWNAERLLRLISIGMPVSMDQQN